CARPPIQRVQFPCDFW
nr:immunoglobulin heavy chain junction region [Macaca mulatta]MOV87152.1 immunoglobulin heavy chain junction region [Macaca mulatta]MOV88654.1 immunoglobulin heavy chain junction region [Macaca mulatta]MOV89247.1 immunoglobulin heavy chain junction region [Macaca mulatta]MOV90792.1 immunoglobulin heavy chain junction region [Macaca mulatta]